MEQIRIISPMDGDMLNERDGRIINGSLETEVTVSAPEECHISVNGTEARYREGNYHAEVRLSGYSNTIEVSESKSGFRKAINVYWLRYYTGRYRLSMDDNIWFLRDIALNQHLYRSVFDNPYLCFLRQVHMDYGAKIHINIYYRTDGFDISMMPDKYKGEWRENADWLRLSFHAFEDTPDKPYKDADYNKMKHDCGMVMEQIRRFAGEEIMGPVTTLHWGEATVEGSRALRDLGYKALVGDFNVDCELEKTAPVSYYLNQEQKREVLKRFLWKDTKEDIIFVRSSMIINCFRVGEIRPFLDHIRENPQQSGYFDLLMHEQYFYPYYAGYQPDYRQKVMTAVEWAAEKGYRPAFLEECIFN